MRAMLIGEVNPASWEASTPMPNPAPLVRTLLVWLLILLAETLLGGLRRALAPPDLEFVIRQASVVVSVAMIFAISWFATRWLGLRSDAAALGAGVEWAVLTFIFEFAVGRLTGASWSRIWSDYDLAHGGLMPIGLVLMALTPWLVRRLRRV